MAADSSVVVYREATVAERQTIVKCNWSDNFGALLENFVCIMYDITSFYNDIHILFSFLSLPTDPMFLRR